jgi:hypothetical protein
MDYGGVDRRKTKGDLKRKRKNRVYKKGGQFRSHDIKEEDGEGRDKMGKKTSNKKKGKKK